MVAVPAARSRGMMRGLTLLSLGWKGTVIMIAIILLMNDKSINIDFEHGQEVVLLGQSIKEKNKLYLALRDTDSKYWMVMVEPNENKVSYSKDKKPENETKEFMNYNCGNYRSHSGSELVDAYNLYLGYLD